jgi:protein-L-isoaspartate(D-aspartate) O-methyltransferase
MHAAAIEHLIDRIIPSSTTPAPRILDVGSGSGYLTHLMAELAGERGLVVGVEHIQALRDLGEFNMAKSPEGQSLLKTGRVKFRVGDGRKGWSEPPHDGEEKSDEGWDVIHVGASAKELHQELLDQIKAPGRMFIPVDDPEDGWSQFVWRIDKDDKGAVTKKKLFGVRYVPLTDAPKG